jgi:hypothetical protein
MPRKILFSLAGSSSRAPLFSGPAIGNQISSLRSAQGIFPLQVVREICDSVSAHCRFRSFLQSPVSQKNTPPAAVQLLGCSSVVHGSMSAGITDHGKHIQGEGPDIFFMQQPALQ